MVSVSKYQQHVLQKYCYRMFLEKELSRCIQVIIKTKTTIRGDTFKSVHEKTNNLGFRPGLTQTRLYSHRR